MDTKQTLKLTEKALEETLEKTLHWADGKWDFRKD